jgi:hypothetical protein
MKWVVRLVTAGGVAAFFFFSWIIQMLWNSLIAGHILTALPRLTYLQAAGLWFLVSLLFAWVGIASRPRTGPLKRTVMRCLSDWIDTPDAEARVESKIKRGLSRWAEVEGDVEWDDLGEHIERKIMRRVRAWIDEET